MLLFVVILNFKVKKNHFFLTITLLTGLNDCLMNAVYTTIWVEIEKIISAAIHFFLCLIDKLSTFGWVNFQHREHAVMLGKESMA